MTRESVGRAVSSRPRRKFRGGMLIFYATYRRREAPIYGSAPAGGGGGQRYSAIANGTNPTNGMGIVWCPCGTASSLKCRVSSKRGRGLLDCGFRDAGRERQARRACKTNPISSRRRKTSGGDVTEGRPHTGGHAARPTRTHRGRLSPYLNCGENRRCLSVQSGSRCRKGRFPLTKRGVRVNLDKIPEAR
jgi:hypothetical protein